MITPDNTAKQSMSESTARELKSSQPDWIPTRAEAVKFALSYAALGMVCVLVFGWLLPRPVEHRTWEGGVDTCKGWLFVSVPAVLLGLALDRYFRRIRQSAHQLRERAERWHFALKGVGDGVWDWKVTTNEVFFGPRWKAMLGFAPHELGSTWAEWETRVHPADLSRVLAELQRHLDDLTPAYVSEHRIRCKDGDYKWVLHRGRVVQRTAERKPLRVIGTQSDISERKRAEQALSASEDLFRTLVEFGPSGVFVQAGGKFRYVNHAAARMFGPVSRDRLHGQPVMERFHPDCHARVRERIRILKEECRPVPPVEEKCVRLDGTAFEAEFTEMPFVFDGEPGALVFFVEVTERKRLEAQLRQAQKLEAVGQLAGGVAHDFNNILSAIMVYTGLLQMNPRLDAETRQTLSDLITEARRAASLARQLLMFSRRSVLSVKPLDVNTVVANLLSMLTRLIGEQIDLRFEGQTGLSRVEADAGMLEQVVMNLVINARDAMAKGGRITISTAAVELNAEQVRCNQDRRPGRFICLAVADAGCGMEEATLRRLFEPFFTTKEAGKGTGLGLATVHGIVAQHNGWVEVESEVGRGTTFRVLLPALAEAEVGNAPRAQAALPVRGGAECILVVEDDELLRQLIGQSLRVLGYRVHEAENGREALRLWQTAGAQVDLLLTDQVMPEGLTGVELAKQLGDLKPGLKVIISSGYSAESLQTGVADMAGVVYLPKPYAAKTLAEVVRDCLDQESLTARHGNEQH